MCSRYLRICAQNAASYVSRSCLSLPPQANLMHERASTPRAHDFFIFARFVFMLLLNRLPAGLSRGGPPFGFVSIHLLPPARLNPCRRGFFCHRAVCGCRCGCCGG